MSDVFIITISAGGYMHKSCVSFTIPTISICYLMVLIDCPVNANSARFVLKLRKQTIRVEQAGFDHKSFHGG